MSLKFGPFNLLVEHTQFWNGAPDPPSKGGIYHHPNSISLKLNISPIHYHQNWSLNPNSISPKFTIKPQFNHQNLTFTMMPGDLFPHPPLHLLLLLWPAFHWEVLGQHSHFWRVCWRERKTETSCHRGGYFTICTENHHISLSVCHFSFCTAGLPL